MVWMDGISCRRMRIFCTARVASILCGSVFLLERDAMTETGKVPVQVPRVRGHDLIADDSKVRFAPSIVPPYLRKAKSVEELLPRLYLKGIGADDLSETLAAIPGHGAEELPTSAITKMKAIWWEEYETWCQRSKLCI